MAQQLKMKNYQGRTNREQKARLAIKRVDNSQTVDNNIAHFPTPLMRYVVKVKIKRYCIGRKHRIFYSYGQSAGKTR